MIIAGEIMSVRTSDDRKVLLHLLQGIEHHQVRRMQHLPGRRLPARPDVLKRARTDNESCSDDVTSRYDAINGNDDDDGDNNDDVTHGHNERPANSAADASGLRQRTTADGAAVLVERGTTAVDGLLNERHDTGLSVRRK